ncbi:MAG: hypothetical protein HY904_21070 [Deltaproteobacteria bacterium]|nr:hypothetical protein [Deltaproteobacteria bacterium]
MMRFSLAVAAVLLVPAAARADGFTLTDARVTLSEAGTASTVEVRHTGASGPVSGRVFLARAGGTFEPVELVAGLEENTLVAAVPAVLQARPFAFYVEARDLSGATATRASPDQPLTWGPEAPPVPEGPAAALPAPLPPSSSSDEAAPEPAPRKAPHPPAATGSKRGRADPDRAEGTSRAPRRKARTERVVECCGVPIVGGGSSAVLFIGAAASLLGALVAGLGVVLFAVDLAMAQRMILAVDRAETRGDKLPNGCNSYAECRQPYMRAFWMDAAGVGVSLAVVLLLGVVAAGLVVLGTVLRRA